MIDKRFVRSASIMAAAALLLAANASAAIIISYTTATAGTDFVAGVNSLTLNSSLGDGATLVFIPNASSGTGVPSGIDLGDFLLTCPTCTGAQTTIFPAFTFDLVVDDTTDGATGMFVGTSTGGTVSSNSSTIQINWTAPPGLVLGPGTSNVLTGNFGTTSFDIVSPITLVVAPNSGTPPGDTTVQGQIQSTLAPEPASFALLGCALLGLGMVRRKVASRV